MKLNFKSIFCLNFFIGCSKSYQSDNLKFGALHGITEMYYKDYKANLQGFIDDLEKIYNYEFSQEEGTSSQNKQKFRNYIESTKEKLRWFNENHMNVDQSNGNDKRISNLLRLFEKEFREKTVIIFVISKDQEGREIAIKFTRITKTDVKITAVNPKDNKFVEIYLNSLLNKNSENSESAPFGDFTSFVNVMTNKVHPLKQKLTAYLPNL
jgi:hypothetical protein